MCFDVLHASVKADADIDCWKVMISMDDGKVNSACYPVKIGYFLGESILGTGAAHSHPRRHAKSLDKRDVLSSEVVHSFDNYESARTTAFWYKFYGHTRFCIVKCTIPKGTWYWHNPIQHEYASFQLKLNEIVSYHDGVDI